MQVSRDWLVSERARISDPGLRAYLIGVELSAPVLRLDDDLAGRRLPSQVLRRRQAERNVDRFLAAERAALDAELGGDHGGNVDL